jgi:hypothetical protein
MANRSKVLWARQSILVTRHHVAGGQLAEHPVKLAAVGPRAGHLRAVDIAAAASGGAKLLKWLIEGLPMSRFSGELGR